MQPPPGPGAGGRKRQNLTLDLNSASPKKNRIQNILTSPDVQKLNMSSPDIEKLLLANPSLATPTPSGGYVFPKHATEEQLMYVQGFEDALQKMQQQEKVTSAVNTDTVTAANTLVTLSSAGTHHDHETSSVQHQPPVSIPLTLSLHRPQSGASGSLDSDSYQVPDGVRIKDEPDDGSLSGDDDESMLSPGKSLVNIGEKVVPIHEPFAGASGLGPIDMESQEKIKLERKRLRNRQAAAKCRKRKLERISQLDDRVQQLKTENSDLAAVVKKMKASVAGLKQEIMDHEKYGCEVLKLSDASVFS